MFTTNFEKTAKVKPVKIDTVFAVTGVKKDDQKEKDLVTVQTKKNEDNNGFARNIESRMGNE